MESTVEIRYAGVVMGRSTSLRNQDEAGGFVSLSEPLPVGTRITLKIGDTVREARVEEVVESPDPAVAGMRVRFTAASDADRSGPHRTTAADAAPDAAVEEAGSDAVNGANGTPHAEAGGGGGRRRRKRR